MATEHQQQPHHHHHHHHQHHHQHQSQPHRRHQNNHHHQSQQHQPQQQPLPGPPHYVDLHVNAGECVSLQLLDGQEQVVAGPATITMVSQQPAPPVPIPVQVPPGHMIHQIADEKGTLKHIILSVMGADDGSQIESNVINLPQGTFRIDSHGELISTSASETSSGSLTTLPQQVYFANYNGCPVAYEATAQVEGSAILPLSDQTMHHRTTTNSSCKQPDDTASYHHQHNLDKEASISIETNNDDKSEQKLKNDKGLDQSPTSPTSDSKNKTNKSKKETTQQQKQKAIDDKRSSSRGSDKNLSKTARGDSKTARDTDRVASPQSKDQQVEATTMPNESMPSFNKVDVVDVEAGSQMTEPMVVPGPISDTSVAYSSHHQAAANHNDLGMAMDPHAMTMSTMDGQLYGYPACCCCCYCDPQEAVVNGNQQGQTLSDMTGHHQQDVIMDAANGIRNGHTNNVLGGYPMLGPMQAPLPLPMGMNPADVAPSMQATQNGMPLSTHHLSTDSGKGHGGVKGRTGGYGKHKMLSSNANHQAGERSIGGFNSHYGHQPSYNNVVSGHRSGLSSAAPAYKMPSQDLSGENAASNSVSNYQQGPMYNNHHHHHHSNYNNNHVPITLAPVMSSTSPVASSQASSQKSSSSNSCQQVGSVGNNYRVQPESDNYVQRTREQVGYNTPANKSYSNNNNNNIDNINYGTNNIRHNQHNNESNKRSMADKSSQQNNHNQPTINRYATSNVKGMGDGASTNQIPTPQSTGLMSPITRVRAKGGSYSNQHHNNNNNNNSNNHHHHQHHSPHHPSNGIRSSHHYANSMNHHNANHHHSHSNNHNQQQYHHHQQYEAQGTKENSHYYRNEDSPVTANNHHHHARSNSNKPSEQNAAHNEVYHLNNGVSIASNKHITSNTTNTATLSAGKGAWQPGSNKAILNSPKECNPVEAANKNHQSSEVSCSQQKQPVIATSGDISVNDKQENDPKQKKCQNQSKTDAGRLTNKILNNGKQVSTKANEAASGKSGTDRVKADSTRPNRESSLSSSPGQVKGSGQKKAKETKLQKEEAVQDLLDSSEADTSPVSNLDIQDSEPASSNSSSAKSTPSKRASDSKGSDNQESARDSVRQPKRKTSQSETTSVNDDLPTSLSGSSTEPVLSSDPQVSEPLKSRLDENAPEEDCLLVVSSDSSDIGCGRPSISMSMRNSFSENNIQSLGVAGSMVSTVKSTQTTPQRVVSSNGVSAMDSSNRSTSGSSSDITRKKGDKRRGSASTSCKQEQQPLKLSSLPQIRMLSLNCTSVTSNSVQLRWSYIPALAEKHGIHTNHHHNSKNPILADHFIIESSSAKQTDSDTLVSPKIVYQGCALSCRVNHLSSDRIYHFRVRRTALLTGTSKTDSDGTEHLVVSEILSVTLPSKQQQSHISQQVTSKKTQLVNQKLNQTRSITDNFNEAHPHELANHMSTSSSSCSLSGHASQQHHRSNTISSHNSHGNANKSVASQPIKFSNLIKQCRGRITSMLGKMVQNSLSSYSDTKFAGLLLTLFTTFAMLLAIFIHIYIVAPVTD